MNKSLFFTGAGIFSFEIIVGLIYLAMISGYMLEIVFGGILALVNLIAFIMMIFGAIQE